MFIALAGAELPLGTGTTAAPSPPVPSDDLFLSPSFVQALSKELADDALFRPIMRGGAAALGTLVERQGAPLDDRTNIPCGGSFWYVVASSIAAAKARRTGSASPPAAGSAWRCSASATTARQGLRASQDGVAGAACRPLGGLGRRRRRVRALVPDVPAHKVEHGGPRGLLHPLPLPSRRGEMIRVDWISAPPTTAACFDMIQNHVDLLSGKAHAVPTRSTATATDAAAIIRDLCLRSGAGFSDVLVVDHDAKFTSEVLRSFVKRMGSCLVVGSAYHKNTNAKAERADGVISDTLRAYANGRKDDWDSHLPLAEFAIHDAASTHGDNLTPFFINRGVHPRLPVSPPHDDRTADESPAHYAQRMLAMEATVAGAARGGAGGAEGKLAVGRVDTVFKVGNWVLLRTKEPYQCRRRRHW